MNQEYSPSERQETPEKFPSQEDIASALEIILAGREYKELRLRSDAEGVHLYEIEVGLENGEKREYNYQRAKYGHQDPSLPTTARFSASIHMTKYDADGVPYDGKCVANYLDGIWQYVPES